MPHNALLRNSFSVFRMIVFVVTAMLLAGFAGAATPSSGAENSIALTNVSGAAQTNYPLRFARLFVKGEIPNFPQVVINGTAANTQADVKQRWPDKSVKHAIISVVVPSLTASPKRTSGGLTLTFQDQPSGHNAPLSRAEMLDTAFNFDAVMSLTSGGQTKTASAREMLEKGNYTVWASGPVATTITLADHSRDRRYDIGFNDYRPIRPIFQATFWRGLNKVDVRIVAELANSQELADVPVDLKISLGHANPQEVYMSKPGFILRGGTRPSLRFWIGGAPEEKINLDHNLAYLKQTRVFPNYDTSFEVQDSTIGSWYDRWLKRDRSLYGQGFWERGMSAAGGREDIGPMPLWPVMWLYSGDWRAREMAFGMADLATSWRAHYREGQPGKRLLRTDRVGSSTGLGRTIAMTDRKSFNSLHWRHAEEGDKLLWRGGTAGLPKYPWAFDDAHQPEPFGALYALSGDPFYLEQLYFWAGFSALYPSPANTLGGRGPTGAEGGLGGQIRAQAWLFRSRVTTAFLAPDDHPEKKYFETLIDDAIAVWEGRYNVTGGQFKGTPNWKWANSLLTKAVGKKGYQNPLRFFDKSNAAQMPGRQSLWMVHMMTFAWGYARDMGYRTQGMLDWIAPWYTGMILNPDYNPYLIGAYTQPVGPVGPGNWWVYHQTWAEVLEKHSPAERARAEFPDGDRQNLAHGYSNFAAVALTYLVDQPDGKKAWEWMKTKTFERNLSRFPSNPKLAILPRQDAAAK